MLKISDCRFEVAQEAGFASIWGLGGGRTAPQILFGEGDVLRLAQIAPVIFVRAEGADPLPAAGQAQVGSNDREGAGLVEHVQQPGRDDMDAGKREGLKRSGVSQQFGRAFPSSTPATELEFGIEQQVARGFSILDRQRGQSLLLFVELDHAIQVDGAEDIDIMENEGLVL